MGNLFNDVGFIVYFIDVILSAYGAGLFSWWWLKNGTASSVFAYVTLIFLGELVEAIFSLYARYTIIIMGAHSHYELIMGAFWPTRKTVTIIALACVVVHMSYRAFTGKRRGQ